jgi:hypothetical protein
MVVIRQALAAFYSGEIVDIAISTDLVAHLPALMDRALADRACPLETFQQSLVHLSRAIYALRVEGGRCTAPGLPAGCGLCDPDDLYRKPTVRTVTYTGADQRYPMAIRSSFGMAFVDVLFHPAVDGQAMTIELSGAPGGSAAFSLVRKLTDAGPSGRPRRIPAELAGPEVLGDEDGDGRLTSSVPAIDLAQFDRLGLIITRIDAQEGSDPAGEYTISLRPGAEGTGWVQPFVAIASSDQPGFAQPRPGVNTPASVAKTRWGWARVRCLSAGHAPPRVHPPACLDWPINQQCNWLDFPHCA